jgi:hypothetical protein
MVSTVDFQLTESENVTSLAQLVDGWRSRVPDLVLHDPGGPEECLVRSGELVAVSNDANTARDKVRRWTDRIDESAEMELIRIRLRPAEREQCVRIAAECGPWLAPHHVHVGSPIMFGTPADVSPEEASAITAPPAVRWDPPVTAAVLDTGLDPHPWFAGRPWFAEWGHSPEVLDGDGGDGQDRQAGHGTFVAGVLLRHAPGVVLRHHRVLSSSGLSDDLTVAAGLSRVRRTAAERGERLDVVVLTAGCHTADDTCPPVLRREAERASGTVVVAAAGNGGTSRPFWPAALPEVLAVGARAAPFSNHGDWVGAWAQGVDVVSAFPRLRPAAGDSDADTETRRYGFARWSGTSFAAPRVAAEVAALIHDGHPAAEARREAERRFSPRRGR